MLQTIIVDQQAPDRQRVRNLLREDEFCVAAECQNGQEAVAAIAEHNPDLVFLDVPMPDLDGFGVIEQVGQERMPPVIFMAEGKQHALEAIEADAVDYLLKPFEEERFHRALDRARHRCTLRQLERLGKSLEQLLTSPPRPRSTERLVVRNQGSVHLVKVEDIDWIEAARNYVKIHCDGRIHMMRETLSNVEARLDPEVFLRIHRSTLVNFDRVCKIEPGVGSEAVAELLNGTRLMVSRAYRRGRLKDLLGSEA